MRLHILAHLLVVVGVGEQLEEVVGDLAVVTKHVEVFALAVDNFEGNTTSSEAITGTPAWRVSETLTSKPLLVES